MKKIYSFVSVLLVFLLLFNITAFASDNISVVNNDEYFENFEGENFSGKV